jgi:hypothetical protein
VNSATPTATKLVLLATLAVTVTALALFLTGAGGEIDPGYAAPFLWLLSALFLVRVVGQLLVRLRRPAWLPPTEEWNLSPYHLLLPTQIGILALLAWVNASFSLGHGLPVRPRPRLGEGVLAFAAVYAGAMVVRYAVRMGRRPGARRFGGTIPIVFHWVLAAYLVVFGAFDASY